MEEVKLKYRGRVVTESDVEFIRRLIAEHPGASRRKLSKLLCEAWNWRQPNGEFRDMVCRSLMLALHRSDSIELPPIRCRPPNTVVDRPKPEHIEVDSTPFHGRLREIRPLEFRQVRGTADEKLFNALIESHHYLGYAPPVGEHLKYIVYAVERPVACMVWASAPRRLSPRDRFIGWSPEARRRNIQRLAYNSRFLILPWCRIPHLASHLLARMAKVLPREWEEVYGHPVDYLETFVDPTRFRGTCYRAANWVFLGRTTGRGKDDQLHKPNRPEKEILGYPLSRNFRELLSSVE